jgi:hypothetical protein
VPLTDSFADLGGGYGATLHDQGLAPTATT